MKIRRKLDFLVVFIVLMSSLQTLISQSCSFIKPQIYNLEIAEANTDIDFSPIDSNKLWIRNERRIESYELDVNTGKTISLTEKFGLSKAIIYDPDNIYSDSIEQMLWMVMSDFLICFDKKNGKTQTYELGQFVDFFPTKDNLFFLGEKGVFVYQRKSKIFSTIFPNPNFRLLGLSKNPNNGFIFINPNTYIVEETLKIHYCTDENFEVHRNYYERYELRRARKDALVNKTKTIFGALLETNEVVEDNDGFWKTSDRVVAFYDKKSKDVYFTTAISELKYKVFADACNLYCQQSGTNKLYIYPKQYLRSKMKKLDVARFEKEQQVYDTLFSKQLWNTEDCTYDEFEKKYHAFKKQYIDTAYNFKIKESFGQSVPSILSYVNYFQKLPILIKTTEKAIEEGRFLEEFGDLPKNYIRKLARYGHFEEALKKYELYSKLYIKKPITTAKEDEESIVALKNAFLYAQQFKHIKSSDSILWYKSDVLVHYRMESPWESATFCEVYQPLYQLLKEHPNSPLVEHCEYRLFSDSEKRATLRSAIANFPDFYSDTIYLYQNFLAKYPQSVYRHSVLSMLIHYYTINFQKESRNTIKQHCQNALKLIEQLSQEFPNQQFSQREKKELEDRIEYYSWEGEIKLSQTAFKLNQPILYSIRLKNNSKNIKTIESKGCEMHPYVRFNIEYDDKQANWDENIVNFCTLLEPPKCSKGIISFLPNEEKMFYGNLEHAPFHDYKTGTTKLLKKGNYKIEIDMNGLLDSPFFEFKIE